jgi:hypothetical protein
MHGLLDTHIVLRTAQALLLLIAASGCHIKLVSDYDEEFVKAASNTQKEISTLLQNLQKPPGGYDVSYKANISTYNKIDANLNNLAVLANSHEKNDETIAQVNAIGEMFHDLEKRHQTGPVSPAYLEIKQKDINLVTSIIIRTENDKKAGK